MQGIVKKLKADKGYGFIDGDNGESLFFHGSAFENGFEDYDQLQEGDTVIYDVGQGRDGKTIAQNLRLA